MMSGLLFWCSGFLSALVIADVASRQSSLLTRVLDVAPLRWLGRVSYGFYLFHGFIELKLPGCSVARPAPARPFNSWTIYPVYRALGVAIVAGRF